MKKVTALLLALVMCLSLASCGGSSNSAEEQEAPASAASDLQNVQSKGTLVVGITDFEPMDYKDENGNWIGFDADLATAFAESLGVSVEFAEINWDNKILELDGGSNMRNAQVVVLPADKAEEYADIESLAGLTFAVESGSAGEEAVNELGYATTPVTAQADALMEVAAGTSDAAVIDLLMAYAMVGEGTSYDNLTYTFTLNEEQYGVAFRQDSDLTDALNAFFAAQYADGSLDALAEQYGLAGSVIPQ